MSSTEFLATREYDISTDHARLDVAAIHAYLVRSYWSPGIPIDIVERALRNSLCFGAYESGSGAQVGLARVVTDYATFAYLCDVYVLEEHRGSGLGKRLMRVEQLMHGGDQAPIVGAGTPMHEVIYEMSRKGLGMTCVVDESGRLIGIITDGDLRRHMSAAPHLLERSARDVMTSGPITIDRHTLAVEALRVLEQRKITAIVVVDARHRVEGVVHLHDLWRTQMI